MCAAEMLCAVVVLCAVEVVAVAIGTLATDMLLIGDPAGPPRMIPVPLPTPAMTIVTASF